MNVTPEEVKAKSALLPTEFVASGYFTIRVRNEFATIRTSAISLAESKRVISTLPQVPTQITMTERLVQVREALTE